MFVVEPSAAGEARFILSVGLRSCRMLVVKSSDAGEVMGRILHDHMAFWFEVKSSVGG